MEYSCRNINLCVLSKRPAGYEHAGAFLGRGLQTWWQFDSFKILELTQAYIITFSVGSDCAPYLVCQDASCTKCYGYTIAFTFAIREFGRFFTE